MTFFKKLIKKFLAKLPLFATQGLNSKNRRRINQASLQKIIQLQIFDSFKLDRLSSKLFSKSSNFFLYQIEVLYEYNF